MQERVISARPDYDIAGLLFNVNSSQALEAAAVSLELLEALPQEKTCKLGGKQGVMITHEAFSYIFSF
jgi:hypothetical protein